MQGIAVQQPKKKFKLALAVIYWPAIILSSIYLYSLNEIWVEVPYRNWAIAHIILHSMPVFLYIATRAREVTFPFIEILAAFNIVHYGLPVFFIELEDFQLGFLRIEGLKESFFCYLIFYSTFYLLFFLGPKVRGIEFTSKHSGIKSAKYFGYILIGCYLLGNTFPAIYHIGYVGFFVYIGLFIYLWREKHLATWEKVIFMLFLLYEFAGRGLDGLISPFALLILFVSLSILMTKSNKFFIAVLVALFLWFYSIFGTIKFSYRNEVWFSGTSSTLVQKVQLISTLYREAKLNKSTPLIEDYKGKEHFLWRFSYQMSALSMVLEMTPQTVPYWNGDSYAPLLSKFVPRFMWPDKPQENMGYRFGTTYNIINRWNTRTSMNTPILAELYMNFGFTGLYLGSALLGLLYFLLSSWFNTKTVSFPSRVTGMAIIFPLMIWESNFSLVFGNLILITFVFFLIYRAIDRYFK